MSNFKKIPYPILLVPFEIIIFFICLLSLIKFHYNVYWKIILMIFFVMLLLLLMKYKMSQRFTNMKLRIIIQTSVNLVLLSLFGFFLFTESNNNLFYTLIYTTAINGILEIDFLLYFLLGKYFSSKLSSTLSIFSLIGLIMFSSFLNLITKDNWGVVGIVGAFLNYILNPESLLKLQNKSEEEIKNIIYNNNLDNIFWLIKGCGLSLMTSWAFTIFVLNGSLKILGTELDSISLISLFTYLGLIVILIFYILFRMIINSLNVKRNSKNNCGEVEKNDVKLNKYIKYKFLK